MTCAHCLIPLQGDLVRESTARHKSGPRQTSLFCGAAGFEHRLQYVFGGDSRLVATPWEGRRNDRCPALSLRETTVFLW